MREVVQEERCPNNLQHSTDPSLLCMWSSRFVQLIQVDLCEGVIIANGYSHIWSYQHLSCYLTAGLVHDAE